MQAAWREGKRSDRPPRISGGQRAKITALRQIDEEFLAQMEHLLSLYEQPYDAQCPVSLCMEERPCFLIGDTIAPLDKKPGSVKKQDYAYQKLGKGKN